MKTIVILVSAMLAAGAPETIDFDKMELNGQRALDWDDETFKDAGKVGLWTKADSVTEFDDFTYAST